MIMILLYLFETLYFYAVSGVKIGVKAINTRLTVDNIVVNHY